MISQLINDNGNAVANQFIIRINDSIYFQSYKSIVCKVDKHNNIVLSNYWNYSRTTSKHLYIFLRKMGFCDYNSAKDIRKAIKNGKIILENVNSFNII